MIQAQRAAEGYWFHGAFLLMCCGILHILLGAQYGPHGTERGAWRYYRSARGRTLGPGVHELIMRAEGEINDATR